MVWEPGDLVNQTWREEEGGEQETELGIVEVHSSCSPANFPQEASTEAVLKQMA